MEKIPQSMTLSKTNLKKLMCSVCKGYLSVSPVDITRGVCGRCNISKNKSDAYEELAQYFVFPCIYPKCDEKIAWGKTVEHERQCIHKTFLCPVQQCDKVYEIRETGKHFGECHRQLQYDGRLPIELTTPSRNDSGYRLYYNQNDEINKKKVYHITFMQHSLLTFAYGTYHRNRYNGYSTMKYCFGVFALNSDFENTVKFEVTLSMKTADSKMVSYTQKNQSILPFDERNHCFRCIDTGECPATYYHKKGNAFLSVSFNEVDEGHCQSMSYRIDITSSEKVEKPLKSYNTNLAKKLECPVCVQYMVAPIYICNTGHSICGNCKKAISLCPYCQTRIDEKRNFLLEELAETIQVNCMNIDFGCEFFGEIRLVKSHEEVCSLKL